MGRSQESFNKKEVRKKKEKKRQDKVKKRLSRKDSDKKGGLNDMMAYVDENGRLSNTPPDPASKKKTKVEDIEISIPRQDPNEKADPIRRGKLTFYNDSKGYGFIRDAETQESVFVHVNEFQDDIMEGNMVRFEVEKGQKGPAAVRVKLA
ncbi:MAG: cold shock domain-containing protein [Bacteroidia bacterium]|nr:MAG: cold shock domain-containing protein [Bacteroidia bacterium]